MLNRFDSYLLLDESPLFARVVTAHLMAARESNEHQGTSYALYHLPEGQELSGVVLINHEAAASSALRIDLHGEVSTVPYAEATRVVLDGAVEIPITGLVGTPGAGAVQQDGQLLRQLEGYYINAEAQQAYQLDGDRWSIFIGDGWNKVSRAEVDIDALHHVGGPSDPRFALECAPPLANFYSRARRILGEKLPEKGTGEQFAGLVAKAPQRWGIKTEELAVLGLEGWLREQSRVTKEDVLDFVDAHAVPIMEVIKYDPEDLSPEFDDDGEEIDPRDSVMQEGSETARYSELRPLPGGDGYTELLITLPKRTELRRPALSAEDLQIALDEESVIGQRTFIIRDVATGDWKATRSGTYKSAEEVLEDYVQSTHARYRGKREHNEINFRTPHWAEQNILVHVRFDEIIDASDARVLQIQEIQSDWHQRGRHLGYLSADEDASIYATVPDGPFKKSWAQLAMKRMLSWAVENGFDKVVWPTTEQMQEVIGDTRVIMAAYLPASDELEYTTADGHCHTVCCTPDQIKEELGVQFAELLQQRIEDHLARRESEYEIYFDEDEQAYVIINANAEHVYDAGGGLLTFESVEDADIEIDHFMADGDMPKVVVADEEGITATRGASTFYDDILTRDTTKYLRTIDPDASVTKVALPSDEVGEAHGFTITPMIREKVAAGQPLFSLSGAASMGATTEQLRNDLVGAFGEGTIDALEDSGRLKLVQSADELPLLLQGRSVSGVYEGQVFYRGEHTLDMIHPFDSTRQNLPTFTSRSGIASIYASEPNDQSDPGTQGRVIMVQLDVRRPARLTDENDPFIEVSRLVELFGSEGAQQIVADYIEKHGSHHIHKNGDPVFDAFESATVERVMEERPYMDSYLVADLVSTARVAAFQGYDAIEYWGNTQGETAFEIRPMYRQQVFDLNGVQYANTASHGAREGFDPFDLSRVGTGQGYASFGWGAHFSTRRDIADSYRLLMTEETLVNERGERVDKMALNEAQRLAFSVFKPGGNTRVAIAELKDVADRAESNGDSRSIFDQAIGALQGWEAYGFEPTPMKGALLEADLPEEEMLLDWDKPMPEQSDAIRKKLMDADFNGDEVIAAWKENGAWPPITGKVLYQHIAGGLTRGSNARGAHKDASLYLKSLGIPGLRYLDGYSREAGQGTHNYVMWDDASIMIREKQEANAHIIGEVAYNVSPAAPTVIPLLQGPDAMQAMTAAGFDPASVWYIRQTPYEEMKRPLRVDTDAIHLVRDLRDVNSAPGEKRDYRNHSGPAAAVALSSDLFDPANPVHQERLREVLPESFRGEQLRHWIPENYGRTPTGESVEITRDEVMDVIAGQVTVQPELDEETIKSVLSGDVTEVQYNDRRHFVDNITPAGDQIFLLRSRHVLSSIARYERGLETLVDRGLEGGEAYERVSELLDDEKISRLMMRIPLATTPVVKKGVDNWQVLESYELRSYLQQLGYRGVIMREDGRQTAAVYELESLMALTEGGRPAPTETADLRYALTSDESLQAANDMGYSIPAYHGTDTSFDSVQVPVDNAGGSGPRGIGGPDGGYGLWFSSSPEASSSYARFAARGNGANVLPVRLKLDNPLIIETDPEYVALQQRLIVLGQVIAESDTAHEEIEAEWGQEKLAALIEALGDSAGATAWLDGMRDVADTHTGGAASERRQIQVQIQAMPAAQKEDAFVKAQRLLGTRMRDVYKQGRPDYEQRVADCKAQGYDGVIVRNTRASMLQQKEAFFDEYLVFDANQVRSAFAAFNPAHAGSSDLLYSINNGRSMAGLYDGKTAYLVADGIEPGAGAGYLIHEIGEHATLRDMLGDRYQGLTHQFHRLLKQEDPHAVLADRLVPDGTPPHHADSERLAYLMELVHNRQFLANRWAGNPEVLAMIDRLPAPSSPVVELVNNTWSHMKAWSFRTGFYDRFVRPIAGEINLTARDIAALGHQAVKYAATAAAHSAQPRATAMASLTSDMLDDADEDVLRDELLPGVKDKLASLIDRALGNDTLVQGLLAEQQRLNEHADALSLADVRGLAHIFADLSVRLATEARSGRVLGVAATGDLVSPITSIADVLQTEEEHSQLETINQAGIDMSSLAQAMEPARIELVGRGYADTSQLPFGVNPIPYAEIRAYLATKSAQLMGETGHADTIETFESRYDIKAMEATSSTAKDLLNIYSALDRISIDPVSRGRAIDMAATTNPQALDDAAIAAFAGLMETRPDKRTYYGASGVSTEAYERPLDTAGNPSDKAYVSNRLRRIARMVSASERVASVAGTEVHDPIRQALGKYGVNKSDHARAIEIARTPLNNLDDQTLLAFAGISHPEGRESELDPIGSQKDRSEVRGHIRALARSLTRTEYVRSADYINRAPDEGLRSTIGTVTVADMALAASDLDQLCNTIGVGQIEYLSEHLAMAREIFSLHKAGDSSALSRFLMKESEGGWDLLRAGLGDEQASARLASRDMQAHEIEVNGELYQLAVGPHRSAYLVQEGDKWSVVRENNKLTRLGARKADAPIRLILAGENSPLVSLGPYEPQKAAKEVALTRVEELKEFMRMYIAEKGATTAATFRKYLIAPQRLYDSELNALGRPINPYLGDKGMDAAQLRRDLADIGERPSMYALFDSIVEQAQIIPVAVHQMLEKHGVDMDRINSDVARAMLRDSKISTPDRYSLADWLRENYSQSLHVEIERSLAVMSVLDRDTEERAVAYHDVFIKASERAEAQQQYESDGVLVLVRSDESLLVVHPSAKEAGHIQLSRYDQRGATGDSQYATVEAAIDNAVRLESGIPLERADGEARLAVIAERGAISTDKVSLLLHEFGDANVEITNLDQLAEGVSKLEENLDDGMTGVAIGQVMWTIAHHLESRDAEEYQRLASMSLDEGVEYVCTLVAKVQHGDPYAWAQAIIAGKPKEDVELSGEETQSENPDRIEDFGAKIGGARKDVATYTSLLEDRLPEDAAKVTLAKSLPAPNIEKLHAAGVPLENLAALQVLRELIPNKPRRAYTLSRWIDGITEAREIALNLMTDTESGNPVTEASFKLDRSPHLSINRGELENQTKLLIELGYPEVKALNGTSIRLMTQFIRDPETKEKTGTKDVWYARSKGLTQNIYAGREEAVEALKAHLVKKQSAAPRAGGQRKVKIDVYEYRSDRGITVGKKIRRGVYVDFKRGFASTREAFEFVEKHRPGLERLWHRKQYRRPMRPESNEARIGEGYRGEQHVRPEDFGEAFQFRGVEFGNWVGQDKRQQDLNNAYDALLDLATVLKVDPPALSLSGELALGFGSRGRGGKRAPVAHYEPGLRVINLTKRAGPGSLGHEWWHAFDHYLSRLDKQGGYLSDTDTHKGVVRKELYDTVQRLMQAVESDTDLMRRCRLLDGTTSKEYYATKIELSARCFERYLRDTLADVNIRNDYLVNFIEYGDNDYNPYPTPEEAKTLNPIFDELFGHIQLEQTESERIRMFSRDAAAIPLTDSTPEAVREALQARFGSAVNEMEEAGALKIVESESDLPSEALKVSGGMEDVFGAGYGRWELIETETRDPAQSLPCAGSGEPTTHIMWMRSIQDGRVRPFSLNSACAAMGERYVKDAIALGQALKSHVAQEDQSLWAVERAAAESASTPRTAIENALLRDPTGTLKAADVELFERNGQYFAALSGGSRAEMLDLHGWQNRTEPALYSVTAPSLAQSTMLGGVAGYFDGRTAYLVSSRMAPENAPGIFLHEMGGHAGFFQMMGRSLGDLTNQCNRLMENGDPHAVLAASLVPEDTDRTHVEAERLAYLVEIVENQGHMTYRANGSLLVRAMIRALPAPAQGVLSLARRVKANVKAFMYRQPFYQKFVGPSLGTHGMKLDVHDIHALAKQSLTRWRDAVAEHTGEPAMKYNSFIGEQALNADNDAFELAKVMTEAGVSDQEIWEQTGCFRGMESTPETPVWKQEISDDGARLRLEAMHATEDAYDGIVADIHARGVRFRDLSIAEQEEIRETYESSLKGTGYTEVLLEHPTLFDNYPFDSVVHRIRIDPGMGHVEGEYRPAIGAGAAFTRDASISVNAPSAKDALMAELHELQHRVQEMEGFAQGGDPATVKQRLLDEARITLHRYQGAYNEYIEGQDGLVALEKGEAIAQLDRVMTSERPSSAGRFVLKNPLYAAHKAEIKAEYGSLHAMKEFPEHRDEWRQEWFKNAAGFLREKLDATVSSVERAIIERAESTGRPYKALIKGYRRMVLQNQGYTAEYEHAFEAYRKVNRQTPEQIYTILAGEVEARLVSARYEMDAEARAATHPLVTLRAMGVDPSDVIIIAGDDPYGSQRLVAPETPVCARTREELIRRVIESGDLQIHLMGDISLEELDAMDEADMSAEALQYLQTEHGIALDARAQAITFTELTPMAEEYLQGLPVVTYTTPVEMSESDLSAHGIQPEAGDTLTVSPNTGGHLVDELPEGVYTVVTTIDQLEDRGDGAYSHNGVPADQVVEARTGNESLLFAGINAHGADYDALDRAMTLQQEGEVPEEIVAETGWFQGADSYWRYELDDSQASMKSRWQQVLACSLRTDPVPENVIPLRDYPQVESVSLQDVLEHEALYEAYPELRIATVILLQADQNGEVELPTRHLGERHVYLAESVEDEDVVLESVLRQVHREISVTETRSETTARDARTFESVDVADRAINASLCAQQALFKSNPEYAEARLELNKEITVLGAKYGEPIPPAAMTDQENARLEYLLTRAASFTDNDDYDALGEIIYFAEVDGLDARAFDRDNQKGGLKEERGVIGRLHMDHEARVEGLPVDVSEYCGGVGYLPSYADPYFSEAKAALTNPSLYSIDPPLPVLLGRVLRLAKAEDVATEARDVQMAADRLGSDVGERVCMELQKRLKALDGRASNHKIYSRAPDPESHAVQLGRNYDAQGLTEAGLMKVAAELQRVSTERTPELSQLADDLMNPASRRAAMNSLTQIMTAPPIGVERDSYNRFMINVGSIMEHQFFTPVEQVSELVKAGNQAFDEQPAANNEDSDVLAATDLHQSM